jgi:hypothetical protein
MRNIAILFIASFVLFSCSSEKKESSPLPASKKIKGMHLISPSERVDLPAMIEVFNAKANFIGLNPEAFIDANDQLIHPGAFPKWGSTEAGVQSLIDLAKERKMQCVISPTLRIAAIDSLDWKSLEEDYTAFILKFARISEKNRLLVFCIGTGLDEWVIQYPVYWKSLIARVKEVYHGDIIYSADFSNADKITLWDELNYLSVSFFETVSNEITPSQDTLNAAWLKWKAELKALSSEYKKELIITKWGYRSVDYAGNQSLFHDSLAVNNEAQIACYEAFIKNCYPEPWFLGSFVYGWNLEEQDAKGYSPEGKSALKAFSAIGKE